MGLAWLLKNWKLALSGLALVVIVGLYFYVGHLRTTIAHKTQALAKAASALQAASKAISERDAKILANAAHEAADATDTATFWKGQSRATFDAGFAAHRCPGEPVGLRPDLRTVWQAGAFTPSTGPVPGKPDGDH